MKTVIVSLVLAGLAAFATGCAVEESVDDESSANAVSSVAEVTAYAPIKQALTARVAPTPNSMYEYELDYHFAVPGFFGAKKVGDATVIGRGRYSDLDNLQYFRLENDGLDAAMKTFLITGPNSDQSESIQIVFSVLEWEKQGRDRGGEAARLLIHKGENGEAQLFRKDGANEWKPTPGKIEIRDERVTVHYEDESAMTGQIEKRVLEISRNETLDIRMNVETGERRVLLGSYEGGRL